MKINQDIFNTCLSEYDQSFDLSDGQKVVLTLRPLSAEQKSTMKIMIGLDLEKTISYLIKSSVTGWKDVAFDNGTSIPFNHENLTKLLTCYEKLQTELQDHLFVKNGMVKGSNPENFTVTPLSDSPSEAKTAE